MIKTIHVTQEDIEQGRIRDSGSCPVANAARRECNLSMNRVRVTPDRVYWGNSWDFLGSSRLPGHAARHILRYDQGIIMEPFEFQVDIPDGVCDGGNS